VRDYGKSQIDALQINLGRCYTEGDYALVYYEMLDFDARLAVNDTA
jgi:hypothetical protein